jgi:hypothetical protein
MQRAFPASAECRGERLGLIEHILPDPGKETVCLL